MTSRNTRALVSFPNLGVLHETKRNVPKALHLRYAWDKYNSIQRGNEMQAVDDNPDGDVEQRSLPPLSGFKKYIININ